MSQKISLLTAGSLVKLNENGTPKKFIFLEHDHYGEGEVTLLRKDTFGKSAWNGGTYGASHYNGAPVDRFCNVDFPAMLDPIIQACLVNVSIPVAQGDGVSTIRNLNRKGFLLSAKEVNLSGLQVEGSAFSYFAANSNRIARLDGTTTAVRWWLRSPHSDTYTADLVHRDGTASYSNVCDARDCPRPALALTSEILVSDAVDSDGCYVVEDCPAAEGYQKIDGVWRRIV